MQLLQGAGYRVQRVHVAEGLMTLIVSSNLRHFNSFLISRSRSTMKIQCLELQTYELIKNLPCKPSIRSLICILGEDWASVIICFIMSVAILSVNVVVIYQIPYQVLKKDTYLPVKKP